MLTWKPFKTKSVLVSSMNCFGCGVGTYNKSSEAFLIYVFIAQGRVLTKPVIYVCSDPYYQV